MKKYSLKSFLIMLILTLVGGPVTASPILMQSPSLIFSTKKNTLTAINGVVMTYKDIIIKGKSGEYNQLKKTMWVYEQVELKQAGLKINSDSMGSEDGIKTLQAKGHVVFRYGDIYAESAEAKYFINTKQVILSGKPRAWQNHDEIVGDIIRIDLKLKKVITQGSAKIKVSDETLRNN